MAWCFSELGFEITKVQAIVNCVQLSYELFAFELIHFWDCRSTSCMQLGDTCVICTNVVRYLHFTNELFAFQWQSIRIFDELFTFYWQVIYISVAIYLYSCDKLFTFYWQVIQISAIIICVSVTIQRQTVCISLTIQRRFAYQWQVVRVSLASYTHVSDNLFAFQRQVICDLWQAFHLRLRYISVTNCLRFSDNSTTVCIS